MHQEAKGQQRASREGGGGMGGDDKERARGGRGRREA